MLEMCGMAFTAMSMWPSFFILTLWGSTTLLDFFFFLVTAETTSNTLKLKGSTFIVAHSQ